MHCIQNYFYVLTSFLCYLTKYNVRFEEQMYTDSGSSFTFLIRYNEFLITHTYRHSLPTKENYTYKILISKSSHFNYF